MADEWFYSKDGTNRTGPVSMAQLQGLAKTGELSPSDLLWKAGMASWASASSVKEVFSPSSEAPVAAASGGGGHYPIMPAQPQSPGMALLQSMSIWEILKWGSLGLGGLFVFIAMFIGSIHGSAIAVFGGFLGIVALIMQGEEHRQR